MKPWLKIFLGGLLGALTMGPALAQTQVITTSITQVSVLGGTGGVAFLDVTNVGAFYSAAPTVGFVGGAGSGAAATATINLSGAVTNVTLTSPGSGYTSAPTVTFTAPTNVPAGSLGVTAAATAYVGVPFTPPFQNESYGPAGTTIAITAVSVGTFPVSGYTDEFFVNGVSIGVAVNHPSSGSPASVAWAPPQPGAYFLTVVSSDGLGHTATSLPVRYFAVGTAITSPTPNTIVPNGSSVVIQATATPQPLTGSGGNNAFVSRIDFYADGVKVGSDTTAPYSLIYTPSNPPTTNANTLQHIIEARAYDNNGNQVSVNGTATQSLFMVPPIGTPPTCVINSPTNGAVLPIPNGSSGPISVAVSAGSQAGLISKVELYVDGAILGTSTTFPYSFTWTPTVVGTYRLIALAYDDKSNVVASSIAPASTTLTVAASPTVTLVSPTAGASVGLGAATTLIAAASDANVGGSIANVQFYADGVLIGSATSPTSSNNYSISWTPSVAGQASIQALAVNSLGLSTQSSSALVTVAGGGSTSTPPPTIALVSPAASAALLVKTPVTLTATAAVTTPTGTVTGVQFLANGATIGSVTSFPYTLTWTPNTTGTYVLTAVATDSAGGRTTSTANTVTVSAGAPPSVSITGPANNTSANVGTLVNFTATAADSDGTVASVAFIVNGNTIGIATAAPFSVAWTPSAAGTYSVVAQATDNLGNTANSAPISVIVVVNSSPVITITKPGNSSIVRVGSATTLAATATDADGTISSVQFFANGVAVGGPITALGTGGYTTLWTPAAEGIYRLTAAAVDNSGATTNATATVKAVDFSSGGGDTVYTGGFITNGDNGRFAVISINSKSAAFIGYSTLGTGKVYYYSGIPVDAAHGFTLNDSTGRTLIAGAVSDTAATITKLDGADVTLIGLLSFPSGSSVASGFYTGSLAGRPASQLAAIVGPDASITLFASDGNTRTAGAGSVNSAGAFTNIAALGGGAFTGKVDPATNFLTGNLTGPIAGGLMAALESGISFSDGFLRNLSSRGQVGTGANVLIAGFVVGGSTAKNVLIRAIGPSLTQFGITGALADPQLQLFGGAGGQTLLASNNNWGGTAQLFNAFGPNGAFALASTSLDAAIVTALAPGNYTAQVSGVNGATGTALVELYDVDNPTAYSSQKVSNISTRALVGTGQNRLIAGFVVSGSTAKKVLVRAVGPTLGAAPFNVPGVLADPVLRIIRNTDALVVRENDSWETGNDSSLVSDAAVRTGAFPLAAGSKDAAILLTLPPGSYSAEVTGSASSTGVALVEVYEVP